MATSGITITSGIVQTPQTPTGLLASNGKGVVLQSSSLILLAIPTSAISIGPGGLGDEGGG